MKKFEDLTEEHFDRTIKTNLYGYFHMAKAAVPHIAAKGSIINTGSVTGLMGSKELIDYSMTKGGNPRFSPARSRACCWNAASGSTRSHPVPSGRRSTPADKGAKDRRQTLAPTCR